MDLEKIMQEKLDKIRTGILNPDIWASGLNVSQEEVKQVFDKWVKEGKIEIEDYFECPCCEYLISFDYFIEGFMSGELECPTCSKDLIHSKSKLQRKYRVVDVVEL